MAEVRQQLQICFPPSLQLELQDKPPTTTEEDLDAGLHGSVDNEWEDAPLSDGQGGDEAASRSPVWEVQPTNPVILSVPGSPRASMSAVNSAEAHRIPETRTLRLSSPAGGHHSRSPRVSNGSNG